MNKIFSLFEKLNKQIEVTHFKSNCNLDRSFRGDSDFDILVKKSDCFRFQNIMLEAGARLRHCTFDNTYCEMEDFLLYDSERDQMHHFHVHYDLIFGRSYHKNYHIPNIDEVFAESIIHPKFPIQIVAPNFELFLLIVRLILKFGGIKARLKVCLCGYTPPPGMQSELDELLSQVDYSDFKKWLYKKYPEPAKVVLDFLNRYRSVGSFGWFSFELLALRLKRKLSAFQRTDSRCATIQYRLRCRSKKISVRWLPTGGKLIAFVGADGAGKSTLAQDMVSWLNYKLSSKVIYLGQKKNGFDLQLLGLLIRILRIARCRKLAEQFLDYRSVINASERMKKWRQAKHLSQQGFIVIADRYPLREFWDMPYPMDGPRLPKTSHYYNTERMIYKQIAPHPDLLIALDIDYNTSLARTNESSIESVRKQRWDKVFAVQRLSKAINNNLIIVDVNRKYELVRRDVKAILWKHI